MYTSQTVDECVKQIKQSFFARRNGVVAQVLRQAGDPHRVIMGCQLTDLIDIAAMWPRKVDLATALWSESEYRECRLIATMLFPVEDLTPDSALHWAQEVESAEVADVLCHQLFRKTEFATQLAAQLLESDSDMALYLAYRLILNLMRVGKVAADDALLREAQAHQSKAKSATTKALIASVRQECNEAD